MSSVLLAALLVLLRLVLASGDSGPLRLDCDTNASDGALVNCTDFSSSSMEPEEKNSVRLALGVGLGVVGFIVVAVAAVYIRNRQHLRRAAAMSRLQPASAANDDTRAMRPHQPDMQELVSRVSAESTERVPGARPPSRHESVERTSADSARRSVHEIVARTSADSTEMPREASPEDILKDVTPQRATRVV
ncbi:hypothetical protein B0H15DRAFT_868992 [Mycena belliarum]|uniref:Uncharacterized protein n=1 Tax=Mycena belliarum TaxID=1033014 RepID=A0AAD6TMX4_9AGAR|nr:hypothetical protein B0H15DRAFT_868992 [Mycena belliae]